MKKKKRIIILASLGVILIIATLYIALFMHLARIPTGSMANTVLPGDHIAANTLFKEIDRGDIVVFRYPLNPSIQYLQRVIALAGETVEMRDNSVFINGQELAEHSFYVKQQDPTDRNPLEVAGEIRNPAAAKWTVYYYQKGEDEFGWGNDRRARYSVGQPYKVPAKGDPVPEILLSDAVLRRTYDSDGDARYDSDQLFCLGDNRDNSEDSRYWGTLPKHFVLSKAAIIYWSVLPGDDGDGKVRWNRVFSKVR